MAKAEVARIGLMDMQVCVPREYSDEQIIDFAEKENPCGTSSGWHVRRQDSELLGGCDERVICDRHSENVHVMLDC